ncbi:E3 SUMO-protein ligase pli1 [Ceratobasidium sp. AG-Ba]|nr:E3 SUMO-protein ligase pli1 [Ceratobasidium sp. AG-Ba]QRW04987.1 E3 SUMO-protein ligase pli1 [Ceratobasidium sp. AG-Ba]
MAERGEWSDLAAVRGSFHTLTVDKLKSIFTHIEEELGHKLSKQGNKSVLIDRLQKLLDNFHAQRLEESYSVTKNIVNSIRNTGQYQPNHTFRPAIPTGTYPSATRYPYPGLSSNHTPNRTAYNNPYAPSNHGASTSTSTSNSLNGLTNGAQGNRQIRFKPSPFYKVEQPLGTLTTCQENKDATDRRSQSFMFTLTKDQSDKLQNPQRYEVRLYCTSSSHYAPNSFTNNPVPIEFPPTCEIRVNNKNINANVRGLKKKPGTAPPPNLTPFMSTAPGVTCKVELVYVNNVTPFVPKKFYMIAQLVETTTVQEVVKRLKAGKQRSKEDIKTSMKQSATVDADIEAGPQKMSLKCPASYIRINTPCRSSTCVHPQCFDAENWFSMMEQTTTWMCPVCDRVLNTEELIIDMYFDDILKCTPESVEDVIVEADGEWHTEDDKYGSPAWIASAANRPRPVEKKVKAEPDTKPIRQDSADRTRPGEFLVLDSDDSGDEAPVSRMANRAAEAGRVNGSSNAPPSRPQSQAQGTVIDLTLSSDDEGPPDPPPQRAAPSAAPPREASVGALKRKDRGATPQDSAWKRPRVEHAANGFVGGQEDRAPSREETGSVRSNSRPPLPNQLPHPAYSHTTSSSAPAGRQPDYPGPVYGYPPHHNVMAPTNGYRYGHASYSGPNGRYSGYSPAGYQPQPEPPLPFTSNGRGHPSLPRPHSNSGPAHNNNRGDPWF